MKEYSPRRLKRLEKAGIPFLENLSSLEYFNSAGHVSRGYSPVAQAVAVKRGILSVTLVGRPLLTRSFTLPFSNKLTTLFNDVEFEIGFSSRKLTLNNIFLRNDVNDVFSQTT
ncbi:hypothetical protein J6590_080639 [Homalodisca vitripennis]|nr:hypothetical protein J6590_080639 [Homalodisca vitripennis]